MKSFTITTLRVILGLVFVFSGFVKLTDPWGLALKLNEYFQVMGFEFLSFAKLPLSMFISSIELTVGACLVVGISRRAMSFVAMVFMALFTLLALYSYLYSPVSDCGCFGEFIKLTNLQTLIKNLILLPLSVVAWYFTPKLSLRKENIAVGVIFAMSMLFGGWSYLHLPVIDLLPYKVGADLNQKGADFTLDSEGQTVLIYKNIETGDIHEFTLSDTTWYNDALWEFVDSRVPEIKISKNSAADFALFDEHGDITDRILNQRVYLICVSDLSSVSERCVEDASNKALKEGFIPYIVTPSGMPEGGVFVLNGNQLQVLNIDATTLKTMIRAVNGVVVIDNGVVSDKYNCMGIM